eukprot:TRINITY_DN18069_c0_g1_i1.p1 TRINITY_DN18069_c0_g1~~TRINITY_DN18069_c0_g1_i1.p1  ORF type:complete len:326 (+),score=65.58 TRINITY_DN18069_c0_g1_i1:69-1046(+)
MSINVILELVGLDDRCMRVGRGTTVAALKRRVERVVGPGAGAFSMSYGGVVLDANENALAKPLEGFGVVHDGRIGVDVQEVGACAAHLLEQGGVLRNAENFKAAADARDYGLVKLFLATGKFTGRGLLHDALDDAAHIAGLCDSGISPAGSDSEGYSLVHFAVLEGIPEAIPPLIAYGADVNATTQTGLSPLHMAAFEGHDDSIVALINHGADVDLRTAHAYTALHFAAINGHADAAQLLLSLGAAPDAINVKQATPVQYAYEYDHPSVLAVLNRHLPDYQQRQPRPVKRRRAANKGPLFPTPSKAAKRQRGLDALHVLHMHHLG